MSLERYILAIFEVVECSGVQAASWRAVECPHAYPVKSLVGGSYVCVRDGRGHARAGADGRVRHGDLPARRAERAETLDVRAVAFDCAPVLP